MATMIPSFPNPYLWSRAEQRLFERLRDELPDDHVVMHDYGLPESPDHLCGEIDFLVLSKGGWLALEAKGGRIRFEEGLWYFSNRRDGTEAPGESPFVQAQRGRSVLGKTLAKKYGASSPQRRMARGYAVFFLEVPAASHAPEWEPALARGIDDLRAPLSDVCSEIIRYFVRQAKTMGRVPARLNTSDFQDLIAFLRPIFDLQIPLRQRMEDAYAEVIRLTHQQYKAYAAIEDNDRVWIRGVAGSGKTIIAMEAAKRFAADGLKVALVCYNDFLGKALARQMAEYRLDPPVVAENLPTIMVDLVKRAKGKIDLEALGRDPARAKAFWANELPDLCEEAIIKLYDEEPFDVLIVDEGQDLAHNPQYVKILGHLVKGGLEKGRWVWLDDPDQNLFGGTRNAAVDLRKLSCARFNLKENCRNTPPIVEEACTQAAIAPMPCMVREGIEVVKEYYADDAHQKALIEALIEEMKAEGFAWRDLIILSAKSEQATFLNGLRTLGGVPIKPFDPTAPPDDETIRYTTVRRFKGLERKAVILMEMESDNGDFYRRANYVGMTRANVFLAVFLSKKLKG